MEVWIENTVEMDYVEKCIENFETLTDDIIDKICERACAYYKFMLEEWNDEFVKEITEKIPSNIVGRDILRYIEEPIIFIFAPKGDGIGYVIEGRCEWEPEHGIDIIILDDKLIDVGPAEGLSPWSDNNEFEREY